MNTAAIFLILLSVFCCAQKASADAENTAFELRTTNLLQSKVVKERRLAAVRVINLGSELEATYDEMASIVSSSYNDYSVHSKDEVGLMLRALPTSRSNKYREIYKIALQSTSKDIRKHAKNAVELSEEYELEGKFADDRSLLRQQLDLLRSNNTKERFEAVGKFRHSKIDSPIILTELAEILVEQAPHLEAYDTDGINSLLHITKILSRTLDSRYQPYLLAAWQSTDLRKLKGYCKGAYKNISSNG